MQTRTWRLKKDMRERWTLKGIMTVLRCMTCQQSPPSQ